MAKLPHSVIKRPPGSTFSVTFTDPERGEKGKPGYYPGNPDLVLPMTFRRLGAMQLQAARDISTDLIEKYVTGKGDPKKAGYEPPEPLAPVDGQGVEVSASTCFVAAALSFAQVYEKEEDHYTPEDLFGFMTVDVVCAQMVEAFNKLPIQDGEEADPLASPG